MNDLDNKQNSPIAGTMPSSHDENDTSGYHPEKPSLSFVQIRQKPLLDDAGNTIRPMGYFKFNDGSPDISYLKVIILSSSTARVYFSDPSAITPSCKSIDGITGFENRKCASCEKSWWVNNQKPKCTELRNCVLMPINDDQVTDNFTPLILSLHGASLSNRIKEAPDTRNYHNWKEYNIFLNKFQSKKIPPHFIITIIEPKLQKLPRPHYIVTFKSNRFLQEHELNIVRTIRKTLLHQFTTEMQNASDDTELLDDEIF